MDSQCDFVISYYSFFSVCMLFSGTSNCFLILLSVSCVGLEQVMLPLLYLQINFVCICV